MEPLDYIPDHRQNPLRPNHQRAQITIYIFWAIIGISVIASISTFMQYNLLEKIEAGYAVSDEEANFNDIRQGAIGIVQFLANIAVIFAFLYWFRRAYGNLHRIKSLRPEFGETWAIWGFILPIISLWYPYKIMKEIWLKSQQAIREINEEYKLEYSTPIIGLWWASYLITNIFEQINVRIGFKAETVPELIESSLFQLISDIITIPAAWLAILVIKEVSKKEGDLYQTMNEHGFDQTETIV